MNLGSRKNYNCNQPASSDGFGIVEGLLKKLEENGINVDKIKPAKPAIKKDNEDLKTHSWKLAPIEPTEGFKGNPDIGILYRYHRPEISDYPMLSGRCPVCGVLGLWPHLTAIGSDDKPTIVEFKNNKTPAVVRCGCSNCTHKWTVIEGKIKKV